MSETVPYVYIWEYRVRAECIAQFVAQYGPAGDWVKLFRQAEGYVDTVLYRSHVSKDHFATVDRWVSREAWESFRSTSAATFEALDARCEEWTIEEREVGRFAPVE